MPNIAIKDESKIIFLFRMQKINKQIANMIKAFLSPVRRIVINKKIKNTYTIYF